MRLLSTAGSLQNPFANYQILASDKLFELGSETMTQTINKPVAITSLGFRSGGRSAYPRRMEYEGKSYNFIDAGLACVVKKGEKLISIFTVTDGTNQFRLRSDTGGGSWTLISLG